MKTFLTPLLVCCIAAPWWVAQAGHRSMQSTTLSEWWVDVSRGRTLALAVDAFEAPTGISLAEARALSEVVRADLEFASLFRLIPEERHRLAKQGAGPVNHYGWESIGADLVLRGTVAVQGERLVSEVRIDAVKDRETIFATRYEGGNSPRDLAHRIADDFLQHIGSRGVAQTRIAFTSDRGGSRGKEIYLMDYDGFNQQPFTGNQKLNLSPTWSPDGGQLAYISYAEDNPDLVRAVFGEAKQNPLVRDRTSIGPEWAPDGRRIAFSSTRDGNAEIYLVDADGGNLRRLTEHPADDVSPSWSPNGREIAFASDRTGSPQIYVMDIDGLNQRRLTFEGSYNEQPAWSPSKDFSEIAFTSRIEDRGRFDIAVIDLTTNQVRQLTAGRGDNESPTWSPNGRHIVFSSNRTGDQQILTMNRDGTNQRQLTTEGNNTTPAWGPFRTR